MQRQHEGGETRRRPWGRPVALAALLAATTLPAAALRVVQVVPQGEVSVVRQVQLRFDADAVDAGDPRATAPFELRCNGRPPAGSGRWLDARRWVFDLEQPLAAGQRCTLEAAAGFVPRAGALEGPRRFEFGTGAPAVLRTQPWAGSTVDEAQAFVLDLNGAVDPASVERHARCEVEGLAERQGVRVLAGAERSTVLAAIGRRDAGGDPRVLLLACQRPLPPEARVRLLWAAGIAAAGDAAAGDAAVVVRREQRFEWTVRPRFLAEFSCERENAQAECLPLAPLRLSFNAPLPRAQAAGIRLVPLGGGPAIAPRLDDDDEAFVRGLHWPAPLAPSARWRIELPPTMVDDAGRPLANAAAFPLEVGTGPLPPLAKFAAAPLAVVEAPAPGAGPAMLAMTLRHVQAEWGGTGQGPAATGTAASGTTPSGPAASGTTTPGPTTPGPTARGSLRALHLGPDTDDATLLGWIARIRRDHDRQWTTRAEPMLAAEPAATRVRLPLDETARDAAATQVLGVPLPGRGLVVLEAESVLLGHALLEPPRPLHARTAALVTNLGVHFKRGRSSSLVWVTTLDRARPVRGAEVVVNDCRGRPLARGTSDGAGLVHLDRGFDDEEPFFDGEGGEGGEGGERAAARCISRDGLFVTARATLDGRRELGVVFSRWQRGIEPWRFGIATGGGTAPDRRAHTVFARTLLRAGEPLHMKHFVREETAAGLARVPPEALPDAVWITHVGSGTTTRLPLAWHGGGRAAETTWTVPRTAPLGRYEVELVRGAGAADAGDEAARAGVVTHRLPAGSFVVGAFRVPLVDARLAPARGPTVAPREIAFDATLAAMSGGALAGEALRLDAVLTPWLPRFAAHEDFVFAPPRAAPEADDDGSAADMPRTVARALAARTDAQGRARLVVTGLPALDRPAELEAELGFTDLNGESQAVSRRLVLWPAAVVAGLQLPGWASAREPLALTALALATDGRPLAGRELVVHARQQRVLSTRTRVVGGFYAYDNRREVKALGEVCRGTSDARGRLSCRIDPATLDAAAGAPVAGEVEFVVEARDEAGRRSRAAASAWLSGRDDSWFAQSDDDRIELVPEKRELAPGERVRVQVRMPFARATVLVSVEREGIVEARVVELSARDPVFEVRVPGPRSGEAAAWTPNVVVSALVLRGRVRPAPWRSFFDWGWRDPLDWWRAFRDEDPHWRAPTAFVDLAKPSFRIGATELAVGRAAQRLSVLVSPEPPKDGARHRVRDRVAVTVRVARDGLGVPGAEVAFAAVDEGLLALAPNPSWQLLEGLLAPRPWGVSTATMQGEIVGRRHHGRKALPAGGGGGAAAATRELFDTLLLWRGRVVPDASGFARIELPLNDSLTRFRLVAVADDGQGRFGTGEATIEVGQDLEIASALPPLVREGDHVEAEIRLRNTTAGPMALTVQLSGRGRAADGTAVAVAAGAADGRAVPQGPTQAPTQAITLAPGAAQALRWPVVVPAGLEAIEWTASARTADGRELDRLVITQRVEPVVPERVWQSSLHALGPAPLALPQAAPAGALPGRWRWQATLSPSLTATLPSVRDWFRAYPYTCLEQQASRAIVLDDRAAFERLGGELAGLLDADGLAAFFPPAEGAPARGSDRLTAHLLAAAHEAGLAWPAALESRMLDGLAAFVDGRLERTPSGPRVDRDERKLAALAALARHGRARPRQLDSIAWVPAAWPSSALLDAWTLLDRLPPSALQAARRAEVQRLLRSRLVAGGTALRFATEADDERWWLLESADANAARLVLAAAAAAEAGDAAWRAELPVLMRGTLARQRRGAWDTTTANLWGALALQRFAAVAEAGVVDGRSELVVDGAGGERRTVDWSGSGAGAGRSVELAPPAGAERALLRARHDGAGTPWLVLQTRAAVPLSAPVAAGYRLTRQVAPVRQRVPGAWSRGDVLRVTLTVDAAQDLGWVVVADALPPLARVLGGLGRDGRLARAGTPPAGEAWPATPTWEERGEGVWRAYFEWLPRGRHTVVYTVRLDAAGRFALPPARVEAMYAPEHFAELPLPVLEVRP